MAVKQYGVFKQRAIYVDDVVLIGDIFIQLGQSFVNRLAVIFAVRHKFLYKQYVIFFGAFVVKSFCLILSLACGKESLGFRLEFFKHLRLGFELLKVLLGIVHFVKI